MFLKGDRGKRGKNGSAGAQGATGPPGQQVSTSDCIELKKVLKLRN